MTKDDLITLARKGKADIDVAYLITRWRVTAPAEGDEEVGTIFLTISEEDGSVHHDAAYFVSDHEDVDLTDAEAETIRAAIVHAFPRR